MYEISLLLDLALQEYEALTIKCNLVRDLRNKELVALGEMEGYMYFIQVLAFVCKSFWDPNEPWIFY